MSEPWINKELRKLIESHEGRNPHNEPVLRLVWGKDCRCKATEIRCRDGSPYIPHWTNCPAVEKVDRWILQKWKPAEAATARSPEEWENERYWTPQWSFVKIDIAGPYPSTGVYQKICLLEDPESHEMVPVTEATIKSLIHLYGLMKNVTKSESLEQLVKKQERQTWESSRTAMNELMGEAEFYQKFIWYRTDDLPKHYFGQEKNAVTSLPAVSPPEKHSEDFLKKLRKLANGNGNKRPKNRA